MRPLAAVLVSFLALATAASAHHGEPATGEREAGEQTGLDTEFTPVAKDSTRWTRVAGADFTDSRVPGDSPTPFDLDLYTVSFHDERNGFAAGAQCRRQDENSPFSAEETRTCERVPVIYRYTDDGVDAIWAEDYRAPSSSDPGGYVADLAWLDSDTALAVGGDGRYPRRELARQPGESDEAYYERDAEQGAGKARAWLYEGGAWRELRDLPDGTEGDEIPDGMRALTALDCDPAGSGFCVAGALGQLWEWREGRFDETPYSAQSPSSDVSPASNFRFRVRDVRFAPGFQPGTRTSPLPRVVAVTAGCCAVHELQNVPRLLANFDSGPDQPYTPRWKVFAFHAVTDADASAGSGENAARLSRADSLYSLVLTKLLGNESSTSTVASIAVSPGAPPADPAEPPSEILTSGEIRPEGGFLARPQGAISSARVVAADGDGVCIARDTEDLCDDTSADGTLDWAVGVLRSSGQGIALDAASRLAQIKTLPAGCDTFLPPGNCNLHEDPLGEQASTSLVKLPSWALNGFDQVGEEGGGWAVGDHGAILRLGAAPRAATGSNLGGGTAPPQLGERKPASFSDPAPYDARRPPPQSDGAPVPPFATRATERLDEPRFVSYGSPDTVRQRNPDQAPPPAEGVGDIVMSRDGSEGWATGYSSGGDDFIGTTWGLTLYHFTEASGWRRCDPAGIEGQLPPDPACASLADIARYKPPGPGGTYAQIVAAARVPLENDDDPTNDDEFEVVAGGTMYGERPGEPERPLMLRYRDGRWSLWREAMDDLHADDPRTAKVADIAFTAPDDGWLLRYASAGNLSSLYRFDGEDWRRCAGDAARTLCADPEERLPARGEPLPDRLRFEAVGERLYLYGTRLPPEQGVVGTQVNLSARSSFPLIIYRDLGPCERGGDPGCWKADRSDGGYDPLGDDPAGASPDDRGIVTSLAVTRDPEGRLIGWASGRFGRGRVARPTAAMLRLVPDGGGSSWRQWRADDAAMEWAGLLAYNGEASANALEWQAVALPDGRALLTMRTNHIIPIGEEPVLSFDPGRERWELGPTPFLGGLRFEPYVRGGATPKVLAPDNQGGAWLVAMRPFPSPISNSHWFFRWTPQAPEPVFQDVAHPIREQITDAAGGGDGSLWVTTADGTIYRYDRLTGWERVRVPGWQLGRIQTAPAAARAVAIGPDGSGVVVGREGRIVDVGPEGVQLDAAAGTVCRANLAEPPCGTGWDLGAAAVAPDDSALVGGQNRALLWRPPGGEFRAIGSPAGPRSMEITGISMPASDRAWLSTSTGEIFAGELRGGELDLGGGELGRSRRAPDGELSSRGGCGLRRLSLHQRSLRLRPLPAPLRRGGRCLRPWPRRRARGRSPRTYRRRRASLAQARVVAPR